MKIVLPFPLPTWNRILAMHHWERKKLRDSIHQLVSMSIAFGKDSQTQMVSQQRQQLMDSCLVDYYQMIRPSTSAKSLTHKRKAVRKKRLSRLRKRK